VAGRGLRWLVLSAAFFLVPATPERHAGVSDAGRSLRTVLSLYWSAPTFPGTREIDEVIQRVLRADPEPVNYFAEYLESDRFGEPLASASLSGYMRQKYRGRKIDVVIAITDVAMQYALRYREDLFPDAAIVFAAVAAPDPSICMSGHGATGILNAVGFSDSLLLALQFHPSATRVFYIASASDRAMAATIGAQLRAAAPHVELRSIDEPSVPELAAAVAAVPEGSVLLYVRYSQDDPGHVMFPHEVAPILVSRARVPVYGVAESYLGTGIVGGMILPREVAGTRVAQIARQILHGTRPQDIPIERPPRVPMFDWRELKRWGIPTSALPSNSIVLFRESSAWERDRTAILITIGVLALQTALIAGLIIERRRRRRAEIDSRRNLTTLAHLDRRAAMGELATSLAHELNQPLNAILQNAGVAKMLLTVNAPPPALGEIPEIIDDIRNDDLRASAVIRRMRELLQKHELESQAVDVNEIARDTVGVVWPDAKAREIGIDLELADDLPHIRGDRVHLQQVLLNLLMNAMDAVAGGPQERRRVRVRTSRTNGDVRLAVLDTGPGIPADKLTEIFEPFYTTKEEGRGMGVGLAIARSIVEAHEGRVAAENNPGGGATVWFSIPSASI
jgi:signal transduction histidine kinase/ABC-type uncharacterized transport system substrate-binding protein